MTGVSSSIDQATQPDQAVGVAPTVIESISEGVCMALLALLVVMTCVEVLARALFDYSMQATDELSAYFLLAITFLSFSISYVHRRLAEVEFVMQRISPRARRLLKLAFDLFSIAFVLVLVWQFARLTQISWESDQRAATHLATPLWIPRAMMLIGMLTLLAALCRDSWLRLRFSATDRSPK